MSNVCICRKLWYSESWNMQNPFIIASRCIFRTLSYLQKWVNLMWPWNSEPWHNGNPEIFSSLTYFINLAHIQNTLKDVKMERFWKIVKDYNHFCKGLYLRSLTEFRVRAFLNTYSLTCSDLTLCIVWDIQNPVYYRKFRPIHACSRHIQTYSAMQWHI